MKKSNKILAVLLALVMMLTAVPMMTAGAADEEHVHLFKKTAEVKADCETETDGSVTYACECGVSYIIETEKYAHKFTGSIKEDGTEYHKQFCDTCEKYIQAKHTFVDVEVTKPATCKEVGSKKVKCSACNYETTAEIEKVAHTCTYVVDGDDHNAVCTACAAVIKEEHDFSEAGTVKTAPKCDAEGVEVRTCTKCTATKEFPIPKTHTFPEKPTVAEDGATHVYTCAIETCGHVFTTEELAALEKTTAHDFAVVIGETSVCDDSVAVTATCNDCGFKVEGKATQHKLSDVKVVNDKHEQTCENCGKTFVSDHAYDEGKETKAPSCIAEGEKTFTCACGATMTEAIAKVDHKLGEWNVTKEPTFSAAGSKERACTEEGCEYKETEEIAKLEYQVGDINGDNKVQAIDARLVLQYVAGLRVLSADELARADVDGNGKIQAVDARKILRIVAELD